jgi:hypothetical protein
LGNVIKKSFNYQTDAVVNDMIWYLKGPVGFSNSRYAGITDEDSGQHYTCVCSIRQPDFHHDFCMTYRLAIGEPEQLLGVTQQTLHQFSGWQT